MAETDDRLDDLFGALADSTRRLLYLLIASRPGLTTTELAARTPRMTRWGVMKHLGVLESAGLIQQMPEGRNRRHYHEPAALEPVKRWLSEAEAN